MQTIIPWHGNSDVTSNRSILIEDLLGLFTIPNSALDEPALDEVPVRIKKIYQGVFETASTAVNTVVGNPDILNKWLYPEIKQIPHGTPTRAQFFEDQVLPHGKASSDRHTQSALFLITTVSIWLNLSNDRKYNIREKKNLYVSIGNLGRWTCTNKHMTSISYTHVSIPRSTITHDPFVLHEWKMLLAFPSMTFLANLLLTQSQPMQDHSKLVCGLLRNWCSSNWWKAWSASGWERWRSRRAWRRLGWAGCRKRGRWWTWGVCGAWCWRLAGNKSHSPVFNLKLSLLSLVNDNLSLPDRTQIVRKSNLLTPIRPCIIRGSWDVPRCWPHSGQIEQ